jgi:hypothetical protein
MKDENVKKGVLPPDTSLDDVKVRIRQSYSNPNVGQIHQVVLKDGPRTFRIATLLEILDPSKKELHHYSLKIDSIDRKKRTGWFHKPEKSVRLEGYQPNEIEHLYRFLTAIAEGRLSQKVGELHIIGSDDYIKLESLVDVLPKLASADKLELVKAILSQIEGQVSYAHEFVQAFQNSNPETLRHIATASKIVEYKKVYDHMRELMIQDKVPEGQIQELLKNNPWMFGSEYSQLLDRRVWTRDDKLDFMLRRTVDDFLEIIEIKKPFKEPILLYDNSHDSFYPSAKLSAVIGQVMRYIEGLDRGRDSIISKDHYDSLKIRARVIIGRDGNKDHQIALRNLNSHLNRIEIITFDQLLRIAERVISVFERETDDDETETSDQENIDEVSF